MPTLYIHIGHEKTGTTTIQRFFHENIEKLKKAGLLYPEIGQQKFVQSALVNCIHDLDNNARYLEFFPEGVDSDPKEMWGCLVDAAKTWNKNILISSEHFISRLRGKGVSFIKNYLEKHLPEYEIKVIVFLRRQDEMFISRLSTLAKAGAKAPYETWRDQVLKKDIYYDYLSLVGIWDSAFGTRNVIKIPYSKETNSISEMLKILNIKKDGMTAPSRFNTSWDALTVAIGFKVNVMFPDLSYIEKNEKLSVINKYILDENINDMLVSKKLISYELAREILNTYKKDNDLLFYDNSSDRGFFSSELIEEDFYGSIENVSEGVMLGVVFKALKVCAV